jgi:hypothetical protein
MKMSTEYDSCCEQLWSKTSTDWHISIFLTLTEPTCCVVNLSSDDEQLPKLEGFFGTANLNESCRLACEKMLKLLEDHDNEKSKI